LFEKKKNEPAEEVKAENLEQWFEAEVVKHDLGRIGKCYFQDLARLKEQLIEKSHNLEKVDIPKEHAKVESRIKNIVKGHRNNYARMIRIFMESIKIEERSFQSLTELQALYKFNDKLDARLDELALHTAKSYQAAQHLFFQPVEAIFKQLQELNSLVKETRKILQEKKADRWGELKEAIESLEDTERKRTLLSKELNEKEAIVPEMEKELNDKESEINKLEQSEDYRAYKELLRRKELIHAELKIVEQEIYSYFAKLSKPLKRYERIATNHRILEKYNSDFIKGFWADKNLEIFKALEGMKNNLQNLRFDSKQQENFKQLVEKADLLNPLREKGTTLTERMKGIDQLIGKTNISRRIEEANRKIESLNNTIKTVKEEIPELKQKIQEVDREKSINEIVEKVRMILGKEVKIV